jgi:hypothetical protein
VWFAVALQQSDKVPDRTWPDLPARSEELGRSFRAIRILILSCHGKQRHVPYWELDVLLQTGGECRRRAGRRQTLGPGLAD